MYFVLFPSMIHSPVFLRIADYVVALVFVYYRLLKSIIKILSKEKKTLGTSALMVSSLKYIVVENLYIYIHTGTHMSLYVMYDLYQ